MNEYLFSYEQAKLMVEEKGIDVWACFLKTRFPELLLYSFSTSWITERKFNCKVRGVKGDLLIKWL